MDKLKRIGVVAMDKLKVLLVCALVTFFSVVNGAYYGYNLTLSEAKVSCQNGIQNNNLPSDWSHECVVDHNPVGPEYGGREGYVRWYATRPSGRKEQIVGIAYGPKFMLDDQDNQNLGAASCPANMNLGHPINVATGNKYLRESLAIFAGLYPLSFNYYYNSQATQKWRFDFSQQLVHIQEPFEPIDEDVDVSNHDVLNGKKSAMYSQPEDACRYGWHDIKDYYSGNWIATASVTYLENGQCDVVSDGITRHTFRVRKNTGEVFNPRSENIIEVTRENGRVYRFYQQNGGEWFNPNGITDTVSAIIDGNGQTTGWRYEQHNGVTEIYNLDGQLITIKERHGQSKTLSYDIENRLVNIGTQTGESIDFGYDVDNRLSTLTDHSNRVWTLRYDINGMLEYIDFPDGSSRQYHYEDLNFPEALTGVTDERDIRYATYGYDADGRGIMTHLANNVERLDFTYHADGNRTVTNSRNISTIYSTNQQLSTSLLNSLNGPADMSTITNQYDPETNNLLSKTVNGVTTEYGNYDEKGQPGYVIEALGSPEERRTDYSYDSRFIGKLTSVTSPSVNPAETTAVNISYDDDQNPTSISQSGFEPDGQGGFTAISRNTRFQYNGPYNQLSQKDGPRTDVLDITQYRYYLDDPIEGNNRARLKEVEGPSGILNRSNILYTDTGRVLSELRPNGQSMSYSYYSGNDRLESLTVNDGTSSRVTYWTYLPTGEVESVTTGYGSLAETRVTLQYDDARRLTRIVDGLGHYMDYTLDTEGNKETESVYDNTGSLKKQLSQVFDAYDRVEFSMQANESIKFIFTSDGQIDTQTDGNSVARDYSYDSLKRLIQIVDDQNGLNPNTANASIFLDYDVADRLSSVTDPVNGVTTYLYDDFGNLIKQTSPDTGVTTFTYDIAGNRTSQTDANGQTITYEYDVLNRLTSLDAPGTVDDRSLSYDTCSNGIGKLCSISQGNIITTYSYNGFGEVVSHQSIDYGYDEAGRLTGIEYPSGALLEYRYDQAGQVNHVQITSAGQTKVIADNIEYAPFGNKTGLTYGNGLSLNFLYDSAYRLTDLNIGSAMNLTSALYDSRGNLLQRMDDGTLTQWDYDALSRLNLASGEFGSRDYDYDLNGNRQQLLADGQATSYSLEASSNRLSSETDLDYSLDANGNMLEKLAPDGAGYLYTYNAHNQLIRVNENTIASGSVRLADYAYNGLGQRVEKDNDASITQYYYGLQGQLLAETRGQSVREYIYLNGQPIAALYTGVSTPEISQLSIRVSNGADDAEERSTGAVKRGSKNLKMVNHQGNPGTIGIRLRSVNIPQGAQITNAYLQFTARRANRGKAALTIQAEDIGNAPAIGKTANNLSTRATTASSVSWNPPAWTRGDASADQQTPDLSTVVQEVVDRSDWSSGNAMLFVINGTGLRRAHAYNSDPALAPELVVEYSTGTRQSTEAIYYYHNDHLGTPQVMTDDNQVVVWQASYSPFGEATITTGTIENNLRFPGQYFDGETGFHYNYFRYYDPSIGRYITSDPIGLQGGLNTYTYVLNNPIMHFDPYGLECLWNQATGAWRCSTDGTREQYASGQSYSGFGKGLCANNPLCNNIPNRGPIPKGCYTVGADNGNGFRRLTPVSGQQDQNPDRNMNSFGLHGDRIDPNEQASQIGSEGCPIINRTERNKIPTGETFCVY